MATQEMNEEELIANGLLMVGEGIMANDMQRICNGYNLITGADLKPVVKELTKLEKIRAAMAAKAPGSDAVASESVEAPSVPKVVENAGKGAKRGRKAKAVAIAAQSGDEIANIQKTKMPSGMVAITTQPDERETKRNAELDQKKDKMAKRPVVVGPSDNSNTKSDVRFSQEPKIPPPW